jgi:hypothetical protein
MSIFNEYGKPNNEVDVLSNAIEKTVGDFFESNKQLSPVDIRAIGQYLSCSIVVPVCIAVLDAQCRISELKGKS